MQSVIIYRNPLEAAMWESLMNGGIWVVLAVIVAALVGVGVYSLINRNVRSYNIRPWGRQSARGIGVTGFFMQYAGWISTAAALVTLYAIHLANIKGWL
jgi:ABC-type sugar transport system permease subunit